VRCLSAGLGRVGEVEGGWEGLGRWEVGGMEMAMAMEMADEAGKRDTKSRPRCVRKGRGVR
jgi:hypothetical protein